MQDGILAFLETYDFWMSVLCGAVATVFVAVLGKVFSETINYILVRNAEFNLNGIWVNRHTNFAEEEIIEVVQIIQRKNSVIKIRIRQYKKETIKEFAGSGVKKAHKISLYYYAIDKKSNQTGTMALEIDDNGKGELWLQGIYYEINKVENIKEGIFPHSYYQLNRLNLSKYEMLLFILKKGNFSTFESLHQFLER